MSKYRKLIVAGVGFGVMVLVDVFGLASFAGQEESIVNLVVSGLTAAGVWAVPNES
jgi:hypothetical protein